MNGRNHDRSSILRLNGRWRFLQTPGTWFWAVVSMGVVLRAYLVLFTQGTYDVDIWLGHAQGVIDKGLVGQYRASAMLNHPPLACWVAALLARISGWTGLPFRILMRAPLALADIGTAFLLGHALRTSRYRWVATALYAINPLAIILSAYHGNTDCLIALLLLACAAQVARDRPTAAGAALAASLWIKLPGLLIAPALALAFPRWRDRLRFAATAAAVGVLPYLPVLFADPAILFLRVFGYSGQIIQTTAGVRVWGWQNFLAPLWKLPPAWQPAIDSLLTYLYEHNTLLLAIPLAALAWMRRGRQDITSLGYTIAGSFAIVYAISNNWSFQYLAWSIPFWFLTGWGFAAAATALPGGYIYALYAFECGNPFLLGPWDFVGHPLWPWYPLVLRDFSTLFFMISAAVFLIRAGRVERPRVRVT
jgi:hypothetical protein